MKLTVKNIENKTWEVYKTIPLVIRQFPELKFQISYNTADVFRDWFYSRMWHYPWNHQLSFRGIPVEVVEDFPDDIILFCWDRESEWKNLNEPIR